MAKKRSAAPAKQVTAANKSETSTQSVSASSTAITTQDRDAIAKQLLAGLEGSIQRTRPTIAYRLAALVVALVMILLPILYIGLIGLVGYGVYYHAINHTGMLDSGVRGRAMIFVFMAYLAPMICGVVLVVFMIKPLFMRPATHIRTRSLKREREPLLFAFVDRICEIVGAAKPKRIDLDCQVNASASFRNGLLSMFGNDLVLTIGLPLVAGLNTRQFAGVLAHEFGHFSQGAGMRLTYIIRSISFWFMRVVYQRDEADAWLEQTAASTDFRIGWMLYLAMLFVWISRRVLWVLMMIGNFVGSYLLRQMEFDADRYETRLAGSDAFTQTVFKLQTLSIATQNAYSDLREFYREGQLGDDLPRLIMSKAMQFPADLQKEIAKSIEETPTGWLDTHPSDRDRIASAKREDTDGIFDVEMSATVLLNDFEAQAKATTWEFYREQFGDKLERNRLRPVAEMLAKSEQDQASQAALERYFDGKWSVAVPLQLSTDYVSPPPDAKAALEQLKAARQQMLELADATKPAFETIEAELGELAKAEQLRQAIRAGLKVKLEGKKLAAGDETKLRERASVAEKKIIHAKQTLQDYQDNAAKRLGHALQLLYVSKVAERIPDATQWQRDARKMLPCLRALSDAMDTLLVCSRLQAAAGSLCEWLSDNNDDSLVIAIQGLGDKLLPLTKQLHTAWSNLPYPYKHAERQLTLAGYLVPTVPIQGDLGSIFAASHEIAESAFTLYVKLLGDLVFRAEAVEKAIGLAKPDATKSAVAS